MECNTQLLYADVGEANFYNVNEILIARHLINLMKIVLFEIKAYNPCCYFVIRKRWQSELPSHTLSTTSYVHSQILYFYKKNFVEIGKIEIMLGSKPKLYISHIFSFVRDVFIWAYIFNYDFVWPHQGRTTCPWGPWRNLKYNQEQIIVILVTVNRVYVQLIFLFLLNNNLIMLVWLRY